MSIQQHLRPVRRTTFQVPPKHKRIAVRIAESSGAHLAAWLFGVWPGTVREWKRAQAAPSPNHASTTETNA